MLLFLVLLIVLVLVVPALLRFAGAFFIVWVIVTYWYIGLPLALLYAFGMVAKHTTKKRTAKP